MGALFTPAGVAARAVAGSDSCRVRCGQRVFARSPRVARRAERRRRLRQRPARSAVRSPAAHAEEHRGGRAARAQPAQFGDVVEGQIADLAVHKGYAYLNSWDEPTCKRGGTYVVDIRDPAAPKEVGFIPAPPATTTARARTWSRSTRPQFKGDLLAVNDETCSNDADTAPDARTRRAAASTSTTSPTPPTRSSCSNAGDRRRRRLDSSPDPPGVRQLLPLRVRLAGRPARLPRRRRTTSSSHDVDIFDITDPSEPELIADIDLVDAVPAGSWTASRRERRRRLQPRHGRQAGRQPACACSSPTGTPVTCRSTSTNPANPTYITDTTSMARTRCTGLRSARGQRPPDRVLARQPVHPGRGRGLRPDRVTSVRPAGRPAAAPRAASPAPASGAALEDGMLNGPTGYGGYGCEARRPIPPRASAGPPTSNRARRRSS